ncbi:MULTISPECIES: polyprenyl synthetase family protein [Gluconobacter]|uniref:Farnesyl-diphosphate synthase n=1 Tax=Gluconobacter cerinus TaxID=38307 RepID=A0AAV5NI97_9PROT|nr:MULTISPECIES: farnesyl diphosphate synthase [Gluconobacter]MBS0982341.1 polyprenyl synthetase family protein [Gluconobacter cerinus]MBS1024503.1 polyprenyl synthetase family protein [Gluconobacter cerinus]MBS1031523.1 polyprenyl synthetase family protein [Gluconobacter cerinus]MBS1036914.1 polyprenyl synthetase family protein [Gluconobacter cerinus]MBS1042368.1 polyprenyl synthetase family protein [Gluconobacter cerinus]
MSATTSTSLKEALAHACTDIEATIDALLPMVPGDESILLEAMRYAALGGGKRLRGFLAVEVASLFGADRKAALRVAASVELLHAYSLVHDDLPSMDDDDLRRGRPSTHRQFDEAIAILAGDALQTRAFEILLEDETSSDATIRSNLALALARASGAAGMVGGQVIDIRGEGRALPLDEVRRLHALKTGALIRYAAESGAILAGVTDDRRDAIVAYGQNLGTAFQVADDVLDTTASAEELGKTAGKDEASGKSTYVSLLGIDGARAEARRLSDQAREALSSFGAQAAALRALADYVVERRN